MDPNDGTTFTAMKLDWSNLEAPARQVWRALMTGLIEIRRRSVVQLLANAQGCAGTVISETDTELSIDWRLNGGLLQLRANASDEPCTVGADLCDLVYASCRDGKRDVVPAWSTLLFVRPSWVFTDDAGP